MAMVYHRRAKNWNRKLESGTIVMRQAVHCAVKPVQEGGPMLATRNRFGRNPYFQFHPLHTLFSVLGALILFGMLIWFLAVPAR